MRIERYCLLLFAEEKTEQPTAKKLKEARDKGQIAQSKDFNSVVSLLAVFVALAGLWQFFADNVFSFFYATIELIPTPEAGVGRFNESLIFILKMSLPLLGVALITGLAASYAQVGVLFTAEPLKPQFSRINPLKGLKNIFSSRARAELVKSVAKAALILYICYVYIEGRIAEILYTVKMDSGNIISLLWSIIFNVIIRCSIVLFIIAVFDYEFKRRKNKKELMMTKQEVKQEYKQSEGDPQLKGKIKEKQRQMAMSRMMQQVPKADVVITNPTHFAVALLYNASRSDAPIVVAKGKDLVAQNIKRTAKEHQIPLVENPPLARTIYSTVEIGSKISPDLYEAVAEVLAYVYSIKERKS